MENKDDKKVSVKILKGILEDVVKARHYIQDIDRIYLHSIDYPIDYLLATVYNNLISVEYILELQIERELSKMNSKEVDKNEI